MKKDAAASMAAPGPNDGTAKAYCQARGQNR